MTKKILFVFYKILFYLNKFFQRLFGKSFLFKFYEYFQNDSYKSIVILDKNINFFIPNQITAWRVNTFFSKEPETIEWINKFEKKDKIIFWDIGANIGLYSIYNSLKNKNSTTIAFEPSSSNLRILTRNISINNLEKNIKVFPIPLSNKENSFQLMKEGQFIEGGALNVFGEKFDFEGKNFEHTMKYNLFGTTINFLLENKILDMPDYIKIDVDGIEHLILEGGNRVLNNNKIKSLSIEVNEKFQEQHHRVMDEMSKFGFKLLHKKNNNTIFAKDSKFKEVFNYVFIR